MTGETLGTQIRRLRTERDLTLSQVAKHLGVSKPTVWAWEHDKALPICRRIDKLALILGVKPSELAYTRPAVALEDRMAQLEAETENLRQDVSALNRVIRLWMSSHQESEAA